MLNWHVTHDDNGWGKHRDTIEWLTSHIIFAHASKGFDFISGKWNKTSNMNLFTVAFLREKSYSWAENDRSCGKQP